MRCEIRGVRLCVFLGQSKAMTEGDWMKKQCPARSWKIVMVMYAQESIIKPQFKKKKVLEELLLVRLVLTLLPPVAFYVSL